MTATQDRARIDFLNPSGGGGSSPGGVEIANMLLEHNFDHNALRPWKEMDGRSYFALNKEGKLETFIYNAPATLRKDEWKMIDDAVVEAVYTTPTRMFNDLRSSSSVIRIPNAMGKTVLEYEQMSDIGPATTSMDGVRESDMERPEFQLAGMPIPIIHKDFQFTARQIAVSRNDGSPLDSSMARLAARKVMEEVEKYTAGSQTYKYATYNIYGYTNFPQRMTQSITAPTSANHATTISEVLSMRKKLVDKGYTGPFVVYHSVNWDLYLDEDYSATKGENTLRQRLLAIGGIAAIRPSYYLSGNALVMVQLTPDVAQAVVGMDVTTLQWPSKGGQLLNWKVMAILWPRLKADINGVSGIVHGS